MESSKLIIIGSSGHAKVIIDIIEKRGESEIIGLLDPFREIGEDTFGYSVIGQIKDLPILYERHSVFKLVIAIGDNWVRKAEFEKVMAAFPQAQFENVIDPSVIIGKNVRLGIGVVIMPGVIVNCSSKIGDFCIINTNTCIDHDCQISDFVSLAPRCVLGGNVIIDRFSAISIGATVSHNVTIGAHTILGAGAVLLKNCGDNNILYGVPAKFVRNRLVGEKYL